MQEVLKRNSEDSLHTFPFNKPKTNFHEQMEIKKQQKEKSAWLLLFLSNEKTFERERKRKSVRRNPPPSSPLLCLQPFPPSHRRSGGSKTSGERLAAEALSAPPCDDEGDLFHSQL